ncbi:hypothetical protein CcaverHIS002_0402320 [Cutaneotrichosporon cavernicola]|uniref:Uncharacterized protein n=1 Tax=Cutaneotrichosporon cavernicola TaxID=279322 RepID=A0AA48QVJ6_9TREE|nr:uncharacterized protein CcaverHIS019_0402290 [Cutaneotrichosporon cavernicola]BEI83628.1 hypothetical protein CcaverHIS002_0402320 [Cutaneotrichosporon cavernicola]BEI91409.1 hypothetical protein CcaverHIS019_0402290 [Cutaneotrichosporon cavernicola]BEI99182.1 hypothetical protein CcaverHIS631_0402250 [Cutaneotrichosporon cavernicola]BEJ06958.1 hypothetical protein CcaverHIS641_0402270 [Cutaneotrichosporon cavernicola]
MLAQHFKNQYDQLEKFGDDITEAQQTKVTQDMVAGAVAYHIARACDAHHAKSSKMDDKKAKEFCEFDNKGLEWLDQKMIQDVAAALVQAQLTALL